ncbi:MAG: OmpA family protein [Acidobacteria bacterium]|nr:OmpA family protein [Acidobacteriota bacterium]
MKVRFLTLSLLILGFGVVPLAAQEDTETPATETEAKDFPYLSRLDRYSFSAEEDVEFDSFRFFNGKTMQAVEGRKWVRRYNPEEGRMPASNLQIIRNYTNAIKAAGGTIFHSGPVESEAYEDHFQSDSISARLTKGDKEIWIDLRCTSDGEYYITAIEKQAMRQDVKASELFDALEKDGFVAIDVNFDTGKATIKADSFPVLDQTADMLKANPALKVSVEGHTDNTGTPEANKKLSEERARAVVSALVSRGVEAGRLKSVGWGQEKPVADNRTEAGRAKNRRVEIVKQ